jgi:multiple sugar transport system substrate-binding protein
VRLKVFMAIAAIALGVAGCGGGAATVSPTTEGSASSGASASAPAEVSGDLKFVYWNYGPDAGKGWEAIIKDFNKVHPNVNVKLVSVSGENWGQYLAGTATLLAGGEKPDLIWVATEGVDFVVKNDLVRPIDDLIQRDQAELSDYLNDVAQPLLDSDKVDGKLYGLPYSWNNMVIYYNKTRFKEAGLQAPAADWTRDDFLAAAKALTKDTNGDGKPDKYGFAWDNGGLFASVMPWIYANGGALLKDDLCTPTVNSPEVVDAVKFMHDLIYVDKVAPAPTREGDIFNLFQKGDIAMFGAGRWPMATFLPAKFEDFDIQVWPKNAIQQEVFGVDGFPIFKDSQNPEAAWAFAKFMTTKGVQEQLVGSVDQPVTNIPARRSTAEGLKQQPPANAGAFYGGIDAGAKLVPAPTNYNDFESAFLRYSSLVFADEKTAADAMAQLQDELKTVVTCS